MRLAKSQLTWAHERGVEGRHLHLSTVGAVRKCAREAISASMHVSSAVDNHVQGVDVGAKYSNPPFALRNTLEQQPFQGKRNSRGANAPVLADKEVDNDADNEVDKGEPTIGCTSMLSHMASPKRVAVLLNQLRLRAIAIEALLALPNCSKP